MVTFRLLDGLYPHLLSVDDSTHSVNKNSMFTNVAHMILIGYVRDMHGCKASSGCGSNGGHGIYLMGGGLKARSEGPHLNIGLETFVHFGDAPGIQVGSVCGNHTKSNHLSIYSIDESEIYLGPALVKSQAIHFILQ